MTFTIHHLPHHERPREKLKNLGSQALSLTELIAIILGSGTREKSVIQVAQDVIKHFGTVQNLAQASVSELQKIKGLGLAKAVQLKAAITLGMKVSQFIPPEKFRIETPENAYIYIRSEFDRKQQELVAVILLNAKGEVLSHHIITQGTATNVLIHPREVFHCAIRHHAVSVILTHNHPSGDPTPSNDDIAVTQSLVNAGRLLNIPVFDHLVVGNHSYVSLRENAKKYDLQFF
ncbi:MAG: DNA repair protein RadC [Chlamydiales bacterium]